MGSADKGRPSVSYISTYISYTVISSKFTNYGVYNVHTFDAYGDHP